MKMDDVLHFLGQVYPAEEASKISQRLNDIQASVCDVLQQPSNGQTRYILAIQEQCGARRLERINAGFYLIGRAPCCSIMVDDHLLAWVHCLLMVDPGGKAILHDLHGIDYIFVNMMRMRSGSFVLQSDDDVVIGRTMLRFIRM